MLSSSSFVPVTDGTFCFQSDKIALLFIENKITFVQSGNCGDPVLEIGYSCRCPFPSCLVGLSLLITYYSFPGLSTRFFSNPICSLGISWESALPLPPRAAAYSARFFHRSILKGAFCLLSPFFVRAVAPCRCRAQLHKAAAGIAGSTGEIFTVPADLKPVLIFFFRCFCFAVHHGKKTADVLFVFFRVNFLQKAAYTMFFHHFTRVTRDTSLFP